MDIIAIPQDLAHVAARLLLATVLGAAIGLNREMRSKPAGLRTHALVSLGAALIMLVSLLLTRATSAADVSAPARVLQGLLAGIGFIGGGVILHHERTGAVEGLTTAASVFVVATVGAAVGIGLWRTALIAVILTFGVLALGRIERMLPHRPADTDEPKRT